MRKKEISRMVKGDSEMVGLDCSRLESSARDLMTIKLIELHNIVECI